MKKWYAIPALASMAIIGMVGCSTESSSSSLTGSVSEEQNVIRVNIADARTHLAKYRRSVVESWDLSGPTADSTVTVDVDTTLQSDNFAVDADVQVEDDSTYTVASAGVDGDGAAWMIQVEGGAIVYSWRNHGNGFRCLFDSITMDFKAQSPIHPPHSRSGGDRTQNAVSSDGAGMGAAMIKDSL